MNDFANIPETIKALEARAQKIKPYSFVQAMCTSDGWTVYLFGRALATAHYPSLFDALAAAEKKLSSIESADGNLARTLGIAL